MTQHPGSVIDHLLLWAQRVCPLLQKMIILIDYFGHKERATLSLPRHDRSSATTITAQDLSIGHMSGRKSCVMW